jgi:hypothetical protein
MKNIFLIISILFLISCETDNRFDENNFKGSEPLTYFTGLNSQETANGFVSLEIVNPEDNTYTIDVGSTISFNSERSYTITPTQETIDNFGNLFSVDSNVTIPADGYVSSTNLTINTDDFPAEGDVSLVFDLSGPDVADFQNQLTINVIVVIPVPADRYVDSTWSVSSVVCAGDGDGNCDPGFENQPIDYQVTMSPGDENREFVLSDVTGGLYTLVYNASDNPATIFEVNGQLFIEAQPDTVFGGDEFNGDGSIVLDEDGNLIEFTLNWSNNWGDAGTSTFTLIP